MHRMVWVVLGFATALAVVGKYVHARGGRGPAGHDMGATTVPCPAGAVGYADADDGVRFDRPAAWVDRPFRKSVVTFFDPRSSAQFHLDVPSLGGFPPAWIPLGRVASGYVGDLKSEMPDARADPAIDLRTVPDAKASRIVTRGHDKAGRPVEDAAVLIVHGRKIYILSVDCCDADAGKAVAALDAAVASIRWTK